MKILFLATILTITTNLAAFAEAPKYKYHFGSLDLNKISLVLADGTEREFSIPSNLSNDIRINADGKYIRFADSNPATACPKPVIGKLRKAVVAKAKITKTTAVIFNDEGPNTVVHYPRETGAAVVTLPAGSIAFGYCDQEDISKITDLSFEPPTKQKIAVKFSRK